MSEQESVFSKILSGELPCYRVYEDEHVLAFLDITPLSQGHTLLIPKQKKELLHELDEAHAAALGRALPKVGRALMEVTGAPGYNVIQKNGSIAGQVVPHVHFHLIPKHPGHPQGEGLQTLWNAQDIDHQKAPELARTLNEAIKS